MNRDPAGGGPMLGVIVSVQGTNPGPASGITYTVDVNETNGVSRLAGIVPACGRVPDAIDTKAAAPGSACLVYAMHNRLFFMIYEWPDTASC